MLGLLYIDIIILLFFIMMLLPITKSKINFFVKVIIVVVSIVIFNSLLVFLPSLFNIDSSLSFRTVILGCMVFILFSIFILKKNIQKFDFRFRDVLAVIAIIILTIVLSKYRFGSNMDFYFETTDPANHFNNAERFAETNQLSEKRATKDYFYVETSASSMYLSYTTLGTIFQIENELCLSQITHVYSFLIFELIILGLTGYMIYVIVTTKLQKLGIVNYTLILLTVFLAMCGYPFNNLIFGYHYLGISIFLMLLIIEMINIVLTDQSKTIICLTSLVVFNIFTTYYMFVPIIYGACGVYFLFLCFINKNINFKKTVKLITVILVIPFVIGIAYYFIRNHFMDASDVSGVNVFKLEGYIYRNLIGNFVLLFLVTVSKLIYDIKNKRINLSDITLIFTFVFLLILFIPFYNGSIASYYFYKLYYVMWPICFIIIGESFCDIELEKSLKIFSKVVVCVVGLLFIAEIKDIEENLYERSPLLNTTSFVSNLVNIYNFNESRVDRQISKPIYTNEELKSIIDISDKYKKDMQKSETVFYGGVLQKMWFYNFSKANPNGTKNGLSSFYDDNMSYDELYKNENIKYVVCYIYNCDDISNKYYSYEYKNDKFGVLIRNETTSINDKRKKH